MKNKKVALYSRVARYKKKF